MVEFMLNPQVSKNFRLSTQQQSLTMVQATVTKADELVKINSFQEVLVQNNNSIVLFFPPSPPDLDQ